LVRWHGIHKVLGLNPGLSKRIGQVGTLFMQNYDVYLDWQDHKIYLNEQSKNMDDPVFHTIGIKYRLINDTMKIVFLWKGSKAEKEGIKAGDEVLSVNGKNTTHMSNEDYCQLATGTKKMDNIQIVIKSSATNETRSFTLDRYELFHRE